ncbi:hypothetical protein T265_11369 [Opisthorchis viverrini]|uniref:Uncharacterized protein n=1 Tax=Opisthorchis viverrini TaxID=6198 RepID=A0A074YYW1_OPIVI|nr:hypothetical protein T265_11369 [Opisthorchis viverrini]KER19981.1 hypothetical protein T265_11369 [Opisthorchis viverrini]
MSVPTATRPFTLRDFLDLTGLVNSNSTALPVQSSTSSDPYSMAYLNTYSDHSGSHLAYPMWNSQNGFSYPPYSAPPPPVPSGISVIPTQLGHQTQLPGYSSSSAHRVPPIPQRSDSFRTHANPNTDIRKRPQLRRSNTVGASNIGDRIPGVGDRVPIKADNISFSGKMDAVPHRRFSEEPRYGPNEPDGLRSNELIRRFLMQPNKRIAPIVSTGPSPTERVMRKFVTGITSNLERFEGVPVTCPTSSSSYIESIPQTTPSSMDAAGFGIATRGGREYTVDVGGPVAIDQPRSGSLSKSGILPNRTTLASHTPEQFSISKTQLSNESIEYSEPEMDIPDELRFTAERFQGQLTNLLELCPTNRPFDFTANSMRSSQESLPFQSRFQPDLSELRKEYEYELERLTREHELQLFRVKNQGVMKVCQLTDRIEVLEQEVEKYRILAGIERLTKSPILDEHTRGHGRLNAYRYSDASEEDSRHSSADGRRKRIQRVGFSVPDAYDTSPPHTRATVRPRASSEVAHSSFGQFKLREDDRVHRLEGVTDQISPPPAPVDDLVRTKAFLRKFKDYSSGTTDSGLAGSKGSRHDSRDTTQQSITSNESIEQKDSDDNVVYLDSALVCWWAPHCQAISDVPEILAAKEHSAIGTHLNCTRRSHYGPGARLTKQANQLSIDSSFETSSDGSNKFQLTGLQLADAKRESTQGLINTQIRESVQRAPRSFAPKPTQAVGTTTDGEYGSKATAHTIPP